MDCCYEDMYFGSYADDFNDEECLDASEKVNTANNIVRISYAILAQAKKPHIASPTTCRACTAALCKYSILYSHQAYYQKMTDEEAAKVLSDSQKAEQSDKDTTTAFLKGKYLKDVGAEEVVWFCEFCGVHNKLSKDIVLPQTEDELYLVKKAHNDKPTEETKTEMSDKGDTQDDTSIIFCIDISGSMEEKHMVPNEQKQNVPVPRINLVVNAVLKQVEDMRELYPNRKIGLVAFDDKIILYGDCSKPKVSVTANLNNFDDLRNFAKSQAPTLFTETLKEAGPQLETAIRGLKPNGLTALGPALLSSLGLVQGTRGSRIILCTDGLANKGLGSLSGNTVPPASKEFYENVADLAVEFGISVSIITIEGNACRVDALGPLTDRTAGTILRVNPANMDLSEVAANSLIATSVKLRVILHEGLLFANQNPVHLQNNDSILYKEIGSVTENNEAYFEYQIKDPKELAAVGIHINEGSSIPLQAQISYVDLKGNEFVRILSKQQGVTKDQDKVQKDVKANILTGFIEKEGAELAIEGKAEKAKKKNKAWSKYVEKISKNSEGNEQNKQAFEDFQCNNIELNELLQETEEVEKVQNVVRKDEAMGKLYKLKQKKKK